MTGHPTDQNDQNGKWDDKTRALVAALEALLELHREQIRRPPASPATPVSPVSGVDQRKAAA